MDRTLRLVGIDPCSLSAQILQAAMQRLDAPLGENDPQLCELLQRISECDAATDTNR